MKYIDFKDSVIKHALEKGLTEYELYFTESEDISASAMMHDLQEFTTSNDAGACFRCIFEVVNSCKSCIMALALISSDSVK